MNYRHLYHAGGFSDVIKHIVLIELLTYLQQKETPFAYLDTHAGIGLYPLHSVQAQKKQEYSNGIAKLFSIKENVTPEIQRYLSIIHTLNANNTLTVYPGSPMIATSLLRPIDRAILCELHQEDYLTLKNNFRKYNNVAVHHQDAYLGMKAFLPPKEKRGLVLIDPAFEIENEFDSVFNALQLSLKHWKSGCYMVWYPVKNNGDVSAFLRNIRMLDVSSMAFHFSIDPAIATTALSACGVLIINPPWTLKATLENSILPFLSDKLQATSRFVIG